MNYSAFLPTFVVSMVSTALILTPPILAQPAQLSNAVLLPSDLPGNFEAESPANIAELKRNMASDSDIIVQSWFQLQQISLADLTNMQMVMGGTFWIPDELAEAGYGFDEASLLALIAGIWADADNDLGGVDLGDQAERVLGNMTGIGEVVAGTRRQMSAMGLPFAADVIAFQRDQVVAVVISAHLVGNDPTILPADLARLLDQRVQSIVGGGQGQ